MTTVSMLIWAAGFAHLLAAGFRAGVGAANNHLFDPLLSLAMIVGMALPQLTRLARASRFPAVSLSFLLVIPCFLSSILVISRQGPWNGSQQASIERRTAAFAADVEFVKTQQGPVICEDPLVCYEAEKPYVFDTFNVNQLIRTGRMEESRVLALLDAHYFSGIQLTYKPNEAVRPVARLNFTTAVMRKLLDTYTPVKRTGDSVLFLARQ